MSSQRPMKYTDLIDGFGRRDSGNRSDFEFRNNTVFRYREALGIPVFDMVLYDHVISTVFPDGVVIYHDSKRTNTTKNRLNDVLIPLGWRVREIAGVWKLFPEGHSASVRDIPTEAPMTVEHFNI